MSAIHAQLVLAGQVANSADADNAVATASVAGATGVRHFILGAVASYSQTVSAVKTITFKRGATTLLQVRWDFSLGPAVIRLPGVLHGDYGEAVSVELEASGTGGTTGRVSLFYAPA